MRIPLVLAGALLLLAGTACGERAEPTGSLVNVYPVTVQGAGDRPAVVSAVPRRIVPLGAGPRRILKALGLERRTVTVNDSLVGLPLVGEIRRAHPDLIIASSDTDPLDLARARTATHSAIYVEPDSSLADVVGGIGDIGLLTNQPLAARHVTAAIQTSRRKVATALKGSPTVTAFVDTGDFSTVPTRSLLGDLIREAHGESVAGPSPEPGPFPLSRLFKLQPQVYLATADSGRSLAGLRAQRATRRLAAIRKGRFDVVSETATVPGPGVGVALAEIARILHPDAFG
jgi:ABC-type Fe3+-hydroxamate transport system substrate-binding protein